MVRILLTTTELGMILYWVFASLVALGLLEVSPELMYADHTNPVVVSWNWSFLPLDLLFASTGLAARYIQLNSQFAEKLSIVSLSLMFCAGLMAISFWAIEQFYDPYWWGLNLWLMLLPVYVFRSYWYAKIRE